MGTDIYLPLHLNFLCPWVDPFPQQPPARQVVTIVTQIGFILAAHIDGNDRFGSDIAGNVRCGPLQSHPHTHTHTHIRKAAGGGKLCGYYFVPKVQV